MTLPRALTMLGLIGSTGCMLHARGMVVQDDGAPTFVETDGSRWHLVLGGDATMLRYLDGHDVDLDGRRLGGHRLAVTDWTVGDGRHGMPTWVGTLQLVGVQIGLHDRNSGAFYLIDRDSEAALRPLLGRPVLIEGYVEGAHVVKVLYYRLLASPD